MLNEVTVVIPAFNECRNIGDIVLRAGRHSNRVIVVDDGSTDSTAEMAWVCGAIVLKQVNLGVGAASRNGIAHALSNYPDTRVIILIDGDGQHDPEDISKLVNKINCGYDLVIGTRLLCAEDTPPLRWIANRVLYVARNLGNKSKIRDAECGFRAFSRKALDKLNIDNDGFGFCEEIAIKARASGLSIAEVAIETIYNENLYKYPSWKKFVHGFGILWSVIKCRWLYEWEPKIESMLKGRYLGEK